MKPGRQQERPRALALTRPLGCVRGGVPPKWMLSLYGPVTWDGFLGGLLLHLDAAPERHVVLDVAGGGLRVGVIPGGVRVLLPIDEQAVVPRLPLPRTG